MVEAVALLPYYIRVVACEPLEMHPSIVIVFLTVVSRYRQIHLIHRIISKTNAA